MEPCISYVIFFSFSGVYQCSECPKQFTTKRSLQMHMNRHTGIGPLQCPGCAKRYMTPLELGFHKRYLFLY